MAEKYKHYTLKLELLDGKKFQIPLAIPCGEKGEKGAQGPKGDRGEKGEQGIQGKNGADGYTPIKGIDYFDGKDGKNGLDGKAPVKGTDYFTETDIAEVVQRVINALPIYNGDVVDV